MMRRNITVKNEMFQHIDIQRQTCGMSLDEFTKAIGIDRTTYYKFERKGDMPASLLLSVCDVLNTSADKLLGIESA